MLMHSWEQNISVYSPISGEIFCEELMGELSCELSRHSWKCKWHLPLLPDSLTLKCSPHTLTEGGMYHLFHRFLSFLDLYPASLIKNLLHLGTGFTAGATKRNISEFLLLSLLVLIRGDYPVAVLKTYSLFYALGSLLEVWGTTYWWTIAPDLLWVFITEHSNQFIQLEQHSSSFSYPGTR